MPAFAKFTSRCAGCDLSIYVDDPIVETDDGWVHQGVCETSAPPERVEPPACPTCWLVHPEGGCDR